MKALAVLFSYDPKTGKCTADPFEEGPDYEVDPFHRALALKESIAPDFHPGVIWAIEVNEPARKLMAAARMRAMGLE